MWAAAATDGGDGFGDPIRLGDVTAPVRPLAESNGERVLVAWDVAEGGRRVRWAVIEGGALAGAGEHPLAPAAHELAIAAFGDGFLAMWPETPASGRPRALHALRIDAVGRAVDSAGFALFPLTEPTRFVRAIGNAPGALTVVYEHADMGGDVEDADAVASTIVYRTISYEDGAAGVECAHGGQCASGYCVDGVCCERACDGTCESCGEGGVCSESPDPGCGDPTCTGDACAPVSDASTILDAGGPDTGHAIDAGRRDGGTRPPIPTSAPTPDAGGVDDEPASEPEAPPPPDGSCTIAVGPIESAWWWTLAFSLTVLVGRRRRIRR
jgi:hypothetical protein